ncbi:hypothetical protein H5410_035051 [Solanum commersonii]|uniref:Uncharacterized protein n=1 Tax=Solanum commersonii TaxID=4109 RepID=A0A9J5XZM8_SOLCO|nr:hypothetical protein H5410_035051 [Solanum commersonii]
MEMTEDGDVVIGVGAILLVNNNDISMIDTSKVWMFEAVNPENSEENPNVQAECRNDIISRHKIQEKFPRGEVESINQFFSKLQDSAEGSKHNSCCVIPMKFLVKNQMQQENVLWKQKWQLASMEFIYLYIFGVQWDTPGTVKGMLKTADSRLARTEQKTTQPLALPANTIVQAFCGFAVCAPNISNNAITLFLNEGKMNNVGNSGNTYVHRTMAQKLEPIFSTAQAYDEIGSVLSGFSLTPVRLQMGAGIKNMKMQNKSLMMKWLWKFITEENMLWKEVICAKYEMEDKWITKAVAIPYSCSIWRSKLFPDLHLLSFQQQATVAEMWTGQGWNLHLRRNLNDWEVERIGALYNTLASFNNLTGEEDTAIWKIGNKGVFSVNSAYKKLTTSNNRIKQWPWKMIWGTNIPYKRSSTDTGKHEEDEIPIVFQADQLWRIFICLRKITWVKPRNIEGVLKCWMRVGNATAKEERWKIVPACIWWTVWKERNQRCFEGKQNNMQNFKMNCLALYYFWCEQKVLGQTGEIFDVLDYL